MNHGARDVADGGGGGAEPRRTMKPLQQQVRRLAPDLSSKVETPKKIQSIPAIQVLFSHQSVDN